jgi:hypothetical protein
VAAQARRRRVLDAGKEERMTMDKNWDPDTHGVVAHMSAGGFGSYHRMACVDAPAKGEDGVRDIIHAPWRYLGSHWEPCPRCRPPRDETGSSQIAA